MTTGDNLSELSGLSNATALDHFTNIQQGGENIMIPYSDLDIDISSDILDIDIQEEEYLFTVSTQIVIINFIDNTN